MGPADSWPVLPFTEVADYDTGRTPPRARPTFWEGGENSVPWVTISDLPAYGTVTTTKEAISASAHESIFRGHLVPAGTLLMSFKLTIGRVATLGIPAVHNEAIISIYPKPGIDQRFLGYYLSQIDYSQMQDRQIKGNTLNKSKIDRIPVPVPPKDEREAIVGVLDAVRTAIHTDRAALCATQTLKRAVSRQVLTREVDSTVPGWVFESIGASHTVSSGGTPSRSTPEYWAGGTIPWVKTAEVDYRAITETAEHITQQGLDDSAAKLLPVGTVLLAMYGQGVTRGKVAILAIEAASNQACAAIQAKTNAVDGRYLYHYLTMQYDELRNMAHGGQQQNLNLDIVRDFPIAYPTKRSEQIEAVELLNAIDAKIDLHEARLPLLEALFGALLTGLMRGDLDASGLTLGQSVANINENGSAA